MDPTITSKHLITSALQQLAAIDHGTSTNITEAQSNSTSNPQYTSRHQIKPSNPLTCLPESSATPAKSALLTLHFLFPFDFLPALDLIDRQLVQKLQLPIQKLDAESASDDLSLFPTPISVFYIQSASAQTSSTSNKSGNKGGGRFGNRNYAATRVHYEVRLDSWNCSCPAFAAASLRLILTGAGGSADAAKGFEQDHRAAPSKSRTADQIGDMTGKENESDGNMLIGGVATREDALVPVCKHILAAALCDAVPGLFGGGMKVREVSLGEMAAWAAGWGEM